MCWNFLPDNTAMIWGIFSAFVASGFSGFCASIGVFSCSVLSCDISVSIVAGLVSRSTVDLRIREYCWCYAMQPLYNNKHEIWCMWMAWSIAVCNTATNARQWNVLSNIIHRHVSISSVTIIWVLYRKTNKNTNNILFVFLYDALTIGRRSDQKMSVNNTW